MGSLLSLVQIVFCPSGDDVLLVIQIVGEHLMKIQHLRLVVYQSQHVDAEGILQLRVL